MMDALGLGTVGLVSHAMAAAAFLLLTVLSALNWGRTRIGGWLIGASVATVLWAGVKAFASIEVSWAQLSAPPLETLRSGIWIGFLLVLLSQGRNPREQGWVVKWLGPVLAAVVVLLLVAETAEALFSAEFENLTFPVVSIWGKLFLAVGGLLLVENLFRNAAAEARWAVKYLCLGLGGLFIYDLYLYADAMLFRHLNVWVLEARGATNAVIMPLLAVSAARNPDWKVDLFVSRRLAFYSATLMGSGAYLILMSLAGYYLREFGGTWGGILQVTFLFGAGLLLVVVLFSGRFRTQLKVFISKHFFNYRYDYREEWLRFIQTISQESSTESLPERAIRAVADIVESPGGVLFLDRGNSDFAVSAAWNLSPDLQIVDYADQPFLQFLARRRWIIEIPHARSEPDLYDGVALPPWIEEIDRPWLAVPIIHHDKLLGVVILQEARAPRDLNWEDRDILKTVGRQVASYLAEQNATRALAEAQQFEAFNRRFAFVLHDIKNLVSQLSLMTVNAEKHANNPEFQKDMLLTVQESVAKMKALLERLHGTATNQKPERADVTRMLESVVERKRKGLKGGELTLEVPSETIWVRGSDERLMNVFEHMIQNAMDATEGRGRIDVRLLDQGQNIRIEIEDDGPGMDEDFLRNHLFRPFRSTKEAGYGIGAFESKQIVVEAGGSLDVSSQVDMGTTVIISLKKERPHEDAQEQVSMEMK